MMLKTKYSQSLSSSYIFLYFLCWKQPWLTCQILLKGQVQRRKVLVCHCSKLLVCHRLQCPPSKGPGPSQTTPDPLCYGSSNWTKGTSLHLTCWWATKAPFWLFALNSRNWSCWPPLAQTTSAEYLENIKSQITRVRVIRGAARAWVIPSKKLYVNKEHHPGIKCFTCWFQNGIWVLAAGTSIIPMELHLSNFSGNYLETAWY